MDNSNSDLLGLDIVVSESHEEILELVRGVVDQAGAEVLVIDDPDSHKSVTDQVETDHQICRSHVKRNADALTDQLGEHLIGRSTLGQQREAVPEGAESSSQVMRGFRSV